MICKKCSYKCREDKLYCPACGNRVNEGLAEVIVFGMRIFTQVNVPRQDYEQAIVMRVDGVESKNWKIIPAFTDTALHCLELTFEVPITPGRHEIEIYDRSRPFNFILSRIPVEFIALILPTVAFDQFILTADGILRYEVHNLDSRLQPILSLQACLNGGLVIPMGLMQDGTNSYVFRDWKRLGIYFDQSFKASIPVRYCLNLWGGSKPILLQERSLTFVDRYRLSTLQYLCPGLSYAPVLINDSYEAQDHRTQTGPVQINTDLTIYTYPSPFYERTCQRDKRYFKIAENYGELADLPELVRNRISPFRVRLEYDETALDLRWYRLDKIMLGDSLLHIREARRTGDFPIRVIFEIDDVNMPNGRAEIILLLTIKVNDARMQPMGLGLDFGTSRSMACLFDVNQMQYHHLSLDLNSVDPTAANIDLDEFLVDSVIPQTYEDYHGPETGFIYPYICNPGLPSYVPLHSYIKRELPAMIRNDSFTNDILRRDLGAMYETIIRRIVEYCLQKWHQIPLLTDICLGCPTVFNNTVIEHFRGFLRKEVNASLIQPSPDFEVTVWDEVWAAFSYINDRFNLPAGHYLIWDMGGGTTDIVLVDKGVTASGLTIKGFNSDYFGGKDINAEIRDILGRNGVVETQKISESELNPFKARLAEQYSDTYKEVPNFLINTELIQYCRSRIRELAEGLLDSASRFGAVPDTFTILALGGGSLLKLCGEKDIVYTLADLVKLELDELLPGVGIQINHVTTQQINPKACTGLGLAGISNAANYRSCINRLPGFDGHSRYNIVRRDIIGNRVPMLQIGDPLTGADLAWEHDTLMYLVFGGSNLNENSNPPVVYSTETAWADFRARLLGGQL